MLPPWSTPASSALGVRTQTLSGNRLRAEFDLSPACADATGVSIDPAAVLFLADHCLGMAPRAGLGWDTPLVTVELKADWACGFGGVRHLRCDAELLSRSGRCALLHGTISDGDGRIVSIATAQFLLGQFAGGAGDASANLDATRAHAASTARSYRDFLNLGGFHASAAGVIEPAPHLLGVVEPPVCHGGVLSSALALATSLRLPRDRWRLLGCTVQFLRPALGGARMGLSTHPNMTGQTVSAFGAILFDAEAPQRRLATATTTFVAEAADASLRDRPS